MSLADLTDEQLRAEFQRRKLERSKGCSGVAATWCPVCGDCTCTTHDDDGNYWAMDDDDCPLHSAESPHAAASLAELTS